MKKIKSAKCKVFKKKKFQVLFQLASESITAYCYICFPSEQMHSEADLVYFMGIGYLIALERVYCKQSFMINTFKTWQKMFLHWCSYWQHF